MVNLEDISCIDNKEEIVECLYNLFDKEIISGFNWYNKKSLIKNSISFSHIHGDDNYKNDMIVSLISLGYDKNYILKHIRPKSGIYKWNLDFIICDKEKKNLAIKNKYTGKYLELDDFLDNDMLKNYEKFIGTEGQWIAENQGWQLDLPFYHKTELEILVKLFTYHFGKKLFDENFEEIQETETESEKRRWTDAYNTPMLILGNSSLKYENNLLQFSRVKKIILLKGYNEISFNINEKYNELDNYKQRLIELGFKEEECLGNNQFVDFIDGY